MKRYLLFDSGCCKCSKIAEAVEQEAGGKLTIRSLRDPAVKELLDRERPGWKWEPMLVEEKDDRVRIYAGRAMSRRLLLVLGPRRAWRVAKMVYPPMARTENVDLGRRRFLKQVGGALGALTLLGLNPRWLGSWEKSLAGRRFGSPPGPKHPLQNLAIQHSKELTGQKKDLIVQRILHVADVQNVLQDYSLELDPAEAIVVMHTLDNRPKEPDGMQSANTNAASRRQSNTLLIVAIPAPEGVLVYYEPGEPLVQGGTDGNKGRYESEAMVFVIDGETIQLNSASTNGRIALSASSPRHLQASALSQNCGGCVDPLWGPWEYDSVYCTSTNWQCVIDHCGWTCAMACSGGLTPPCLVCVLAYCPYWVCCGCCNHWEPTCSYCGTPP